MFGIPAGAATAGKMALPAAAGAPWSMILPIAFSLLSGMGAFGGGSDPDAEYNEYKQRRTEGQLDSLLRSMIGQGKYWNSQAMGLNPKVLQAVLNNYQRLANFGYPGGMQMDIDFLSQLFPTDSAGMNYSGVKKRG